MMPVVLTPDALHASLEKLFGWSVVDGQLSKLFSFQDFKESMSFVNQVARFAEAMDHHPDILIQYNTVKLLLSTHSVGGITELDIQLARQINTL